MTTSEPELLSQKPLNELFSHLPTTVFEVMSKLAMEHSSVNLGQVGKQGPVMVNDLVTAMPIVDRTCCCVHKG